MKVSIIVGSHRPQSRSRKVALFVEASFRRQFPSATFHVLDLARTPLPLWDESCWTSTPNAIETWGPMAKELRESDAFVVVSPEWGGMVPAALKNLFLIAGTAELGHKPALIVGVSASQGGAYPVAELRASSYKNNHLCYIPEHVIVRDVKNVLNDPENASSPADEYIRKRIAYAVRVLEVYARALLLVRTSGVPDPKAYPFGM